MTINAYGMICSKINLPLQIEPGMNECTDSGRRGQCITPLAHLLLQLHV